MQFIGQERDTLLILWVFMATLCIYTAQRLVKLKSYSLHTEQMAWVAKQRISLTCIAGISALGTGIIGLMLPFMAMWSLWPWALISLLYALPFIPEGKDKKALRETPGIKIFLIAAVWTGITLVLPMKISGINIGLAEKAMLLERFLFILAITIPFDIRDMKMDDPKMRTLAQILGANRAAFLGLLLLTTCVFIQGSLWQSKLITSARFVSISTIYLSAMVLIWRGRKARAYWFYNGMLDGLMALLGASFLFFQ